MLFPDLRCIQTLKSNIVIKKSIFIKSIHVIALTVYLGGTSFTYNLDSGYNVVVFFLRSVELAFGM